MVIGGTRTPVLVLVSLVGIQLLHRELSSDKQQKHLPHDPPHNSKQVQILVCRLWLHPAPVRSSHTRLVRAKTRSINDNNGLLFTGYCSANFPTLHL